MLYYGMMVRIGVCAPWMVVGIDTLRSGEWGHYSLLHMVLEREGFGGKAWKDGIRRIERMAYIMGVGWL